MGSHDHLGIVLATESGKRLDKLVLPGRVQVDLRLVNEDDAAVANAPLQIRVRGETYHRAQVSCMGKNHYVYCSEKIWPHDPAKVLLDWYHGEAIDKYERKD